MADLVELNTEKLIPQYEMMEQSKLFDKEELRAIAKRRNHFEYKLAKITKTKDDSLRYIQYEMDLMKLIRQKKAQLGIAAKKTDVDFYIANHVNSLFNQAIRRYPSDERIWFSYIKFCKQVRFIACASRILDQFLALHNGKPHLFVFAADFEYNMCHCVDKARKYLLTGLHLHKDSKMLYRASFRLELEFATLKRKEIEESGTEIDPEDTILQGKLAEVIYDSAVKKIHDVKFIAELLTLAKEFTFTKKIQEKIFDDLIVYHCNEEITWDILAKRELDSNEDKFGTKERIMNCATIYENAVKSVNTEYMWMLYLDKMYELSKDNSIALTNVKKNCFTRALVGAHEAGMLTEKYYLIWAEQIQDKGDRIYAILKSGTEKLPESGLLWFKRLQYHLKKQDDAGGWIIFNEATNALKGNEIDLVPLWKHMFQFYQISDPDGTKAEELFSKGLTSGFMNITKMLKPMYLEWVTLSRGICAGRKLYNEIAKDPPFSLEVHQKMIELEDNQAKLCMKHMRRCHMFATKQFGQTNTDVWMAYIKFEETFGDPLSIPKIYAEATKNLNNHLIDMFVSEFSLNRANLLSTPSLTPSSQKEPTTPIPIEPMDSTSFQGGVLSNV